MAVSAKLKANLKTSQIAYIKLCEIKYNYIHYENNN